MLSTTTSSLVTPTSYIYNPDHSPWVIPKCQAVHISQVTQNTFKSELNHPPASTKLLLCLSFCSSSIPTRIPSKLETGRFPGHSLNFSHPHPTYHRVLLIFFPICTAQASFLYLMSSQDSQFLRHGVVTSLPDPSNPPHGVQKP